MANKELRVIKLTSKLMLRVIELKLEKSIEDELISKIADISVTRCCDKLPKSDIILARYLHDSYELIAKKQDWNTQENCKVDFSDLPIENKNTMIFLAGKIIQDFGGN